MSDVSGGPGWWQASDGKWYRPEQHPDYQPSPPSVSLPPPVMPTQPSQTPPIAPYVAPIMVASESAMPTTEKRRNVIKKAALTTWEGIWYVLMCIGFGAGYFAKIPAKKAMKDFGLTEMTGAEQFWYVLMCIAFGAGYFAKIPVAKALSELPQYRTQVQAGLGTLGQT